MPDFFLAMFETFLSHHLNRRRVSLNCMDLPVHDREDAMPWPQNDRVGILNRLDTGAVEGSMAPLTTLGCSLYMMLVDHPVDDGGRFGVDLGLDVLLAQSAIEQ